MNRSPFSLFAPFSDSLRIDFLTKEDGIATDDAAAGALGITDFSSAEQTHGKESAVVHEPVKRLKGVDGLMTDAPNLTLLIRVADCQSFVFYNPTKHAAGVLHAGWRGIVAGAIPSFLASFRAEWKSDPADIFVGAAPSLCQACAEFTDPHKELPGIDPRFFNGRHVDLRGIADDQLMKEGIRADQMERSTDCVLCKCETYWSYREGSREAVQEGYRNVLACTLKSPAPE